jgi:hypothetical protein
VIWEEPAAGHQQRFKTGFGGFFVSSGVYI